MRSSNDLVKNKWQLPGNLRNRIRISGYNKKEMVRSDRSRRSPYLLALCLYSIWTVYPKRILFLSSEMYVLRIQNLRYDESKVKDFESIRVDMV